MNGITIVNFTHELGPEQLTAIEQHVGQRIDRVVNALTDFEHETPFAEQSWALLDSVDVDWENLSLLIVPPAYSPITAVLLAQLHGLIGHFPTIVRLRPVTGHIPKRFELAEIVDLDEIRMEARRRRSR